MARTALRRKLQVAIIASAVAHAVGLTVLACVVMPEIKSKFFDVQPRPFAGQQVAIAMSIARPEATLPPLPEQPPVESTVLVTRDEAQVADHVYVDKSASEVAPSPTTTTLNVELGEMQAVDLPLAERETPARPSPPANTTPKPTTALARTVRQPMPSTASVTVPPQTLGTHPDKTARLHQNRPPRFPDIARQNGWQGTVLLKLAISASGQVTKVEVMESSGFAVLDAEAASAVRIWTGEPAQRNGVAVASEVYLPIRFRL